MPGMLRRMAGRLRGGASPPVKFSSVEFVVGRGQTFGCEVARHQPVRVECGFSPDFDFVGMAFHHADGRVERVALPVETFVEFMAVQAAVVENWSKEGVIAVDRLAGGIGAS